MKTIKFVLVVISMCLIVVVSIKLMSMLCTHLVNSGEKVGTVIKASQQGFFFKTNEVEIVRGGMNAGSGSFSVTPLNGTVHDDKLFKQLQDALENQYEIRVQYRDYFWTPISSDNGGLYIVSMQKLSHR